MPLVLTDRPQPAAVRARAVKSEAMLGEVVQDRLRRLAARALEGRGDVIDQVAARALDPYSAAESLLAPFLAAPVAEG